MSVRLILAQETILVVYGAIESQVCKNILFEKVLELVYDNDEDVKVATIKLMVDLLKEIDETSKREKIAQLFSEILSNLHDKIIMAISECLARIIVDLGDIMMKNNSYLNSIINFYKEISRSKNDEIKCNFLLNFPAMIKFVDVKIYGNFKHIYLLHYNSKNAKIRLYWFYILLDIVDLIEEEERFTVLKPLLEEFLVNEQDE